jgi:hypothetical protein
MIASVRPPEIIALVIGIACAGGAAVLVAMHLTKRPEVPAPAASVSAPTSASQAPAMNPNEPAVELVAVMRRDWPIASECVAAENAWTKCYDEEKKGFAALLTCTDEATKKCELAGPKMAATSATTPCATAAEKQMREYLSERAKFQRAWVDWLETMKKDLEPKLANQTLQAVKKDPKNAKLLKDEPLVGEYGPAADQGPTGKLECIRDIATCVHEANGNEVRSPCTDHTLLCRLRLKVDCPGGSVFSMGGARL